MIRERHPTKRIILTLMILSLAIINAGCSFSIPFSLKNLSGKTITVSYSTSNLHYGFEPRLIRDNVDNSNNKYYPIPEDRIIIDIENRTVKFDLLPNEEVELFWMVDRVDSDYEGEFNIEMLKISDVDGSVTFEDRQVFKNFKPVRNRLPIFGPEIVSYVFEYR